MMHLKASAFALVLLVPLAANAQDPAAPAAPPPPPADTAAPPAPAPMPMPAPAPAPAPAASAPVALAWDGIVDMFYQGNFTGKPMTTGPGFRAFDTTSKSFSLSYVKLGLSANADPVGARVDLGYGQTAMIINAGNSGAGPFGGGGAFIAQQAYGYAKFSDTVSLDAGKFVTTAGSEVIESNKNWLYSRSFLFNGIPFVHTGLRLNLKLTGEITAQASVVNGWNNDPDNNNAPSGGINVAYASGPTLVALTSYIGKEATSEVNILVDLVAQQAVNDKLTVNLNFDYNKEASANWLGAALMAKMILTEKLNLAARLEFLKSKGLYGGLTDDMLYGATVGLGMPMGKNYEIRAEVRADMSNHEVYTKTAGTKAAPVIPMPGVMPMAPAAASAAVMAKSQFTGLLAFLAYF